MCKVPPMRGLALDLDAILDDIGSFATFWLETRRKRVSTTIAARCCRAAGLSPPI